jgi:DNA (cytosine-5)-methyltransferase 1
MFGIPHIRERAFIVGRLSSLKDFVWPVHDKKAQPSISSILDVEVTESKTLGKSFHGYLDAWQKLLDHLNPDNPLPSFPIWAAEFGATYPADGIAPLQRKPADMMQFKGAFGVDLSDLSVQELEASLPPYARTQQPFPAWKTAFIMQNRKFYTNNKEVIDNWLPSIASFAPSFQKFEWNWKGGPRDISKAIIQFRASGIRVKRPTAAPSLVALTTSQIPVIGWDRRYMTLKECARLQSMGDLKHFPARRGDAFKALGNAINVEVVHAIANSLFSTAKKLPKQVRIKPVKSLHLSTEGPLREAATSL